MALVPALLIALSIAVVFYLYRAGQASAAVGADDQAPVPEDGLKAIEYFWRPG